MTTRDLPATSTLVQASGQPAVRAAAALCWVNAVGFGVFTIPAIARVRVGKDLPIVMGFPAYGRGPFEAHGVKSTVPLLAGFLVVCIVEGVAGWLLWRGRRSGAIVAIGVLPAGAVYWWGFALPIPPVFALVRTALIVSRWAKLR